MLQLKLLNIVLLATILMVGATNAAKRPYESLGFKPTAIPLLNFRSLGASRPSSPPGENGSTTCAPTFPICAPASVWNLKPSTKRKTLPITTAIWTTRQWKKERAKKKPLSR